MCWHVQLSGAITKLEIRRKYKKVWKRKYCSYSHSSADALFNHEIPVICFAANLLHYEWWCVRFAWWWLKWQTQIHQLSPLPLGGFCNSILPFPAVGSTLGNKCLLCTSKQCLLLEFQFSIPIVTPLMHLSIHYSVIPCSHLE